MVTKKVLIIDDEKLIVKSTSMALRYYGYDVIEACNGTVGLTHAMKETPGLILLDIMMPGMDGWEVLSRLKSEDATRNIPVIIFTAKEYSNGLALAISKGAVDYIPKPFEPDTLNKLIRKHLTVKE